MKLESELLLQHDLTSVHLKIVREGRQERFDWFGIEPFDKQNYLELRLSNIITLKIVATLDLFYLPFCDSCLYLRRLYLDFNYV